MNSDGTKRQTFVSFDGIELCFFDNGAVGRPVILLHGLIVDSETNFGLDAYSETGRRVILLDARGHGCSQKPREPEAYADRAMARDVLALIKHLDLSSTDLMGYSMGGYTAIEAAIIDDEKIGTLILGGVGNAEGTESWFRERSAEMLTDNPDEDAFYRRFADEMGADPKAIGAWFLGAEFPQIGENTDLSRIDVEAHIYNASEDEDPAALAARFQRSQHARYDGDHVSVLENPRYIARVTEVLSADTE